jgi:hypothetical protein
MLSELDVSLLSWPHHGYAELLVLTSDGFDGKGARLYRQFRNERSETPPQDKLELDTEGEFASAAVPTDAVEQVRSLVRDLSLPLVVSASLTLGGTQHALRIDSDFVAVVLEWGSTLPEEWAALTPLLAQLTTLRASFEP